MTKTPKYHKKTSQKRLKSSETDLSNTSCNCRCLEGAGRVRHQRREQSAHREDSISSSSSSSLGKRQWLKRRSMSCQPKSKWDPSQTSNSYLLCQNFTGGCACCSGQGIWDIIMSGDVFILMTLHLHHVQWSTGLHMNARC